MMLNDALRIIQKYTPGAVLHPEIEKAVTRLSLDQYDDGYEAGRLATGDDS